MVVVRKQAFPPGMLAVLLFAVLAGVALYGVLGRVDSAGALGDSPEDLHAYIETAEVRLQEASAGNDQAAVRNEAQLIQSAAERLLSAEPNDEQRAYAIAAKFTCLSVMIQQDEPGSVDAMLAFAEAHLDDADPAIAARSAATVLGLEISLLDSPRLIAEETAGKLARAVNAYLSRPGIVDYDLPQYGLNLIALSEAPQLAAAGYRAMAEQSDKFNAPPEVQQLFRTRFANAAALMDSIGKPIELEGDLLDGSTLDWSAYRDRTVLVIFLVAGHDQFLSELPQLKRLYGHFHQAGFEIVLVSLDADRAAVEKFLADQRISWPTLFSGDPTATGMDHPMAVKYGVLMPMSMILVDRPGNVVCFNAMGRKLVRYLEEEYGPLPEEIPVAEEPANDAAPANEPGDEPAADSGDRPEADPGAQDPVPPAEAAAEPDPVEVREDPADAPPPPQASP